MKTVNWTYVSAAPLNDPIVLEFVVQRASLGASDYGEKRPLLFRVSLDRQALNRVVRVDYDEENKRLSVTVDGHSQSFVQPVSGGGV